MPWKVQGPMDQKLEFIRRLTGGESMTALCVEYGISRKTGHKLKARHAALGASGLKELSRAPKRVANRTTPETAKLIVGEKKKHPTWGPKKLKALLEQKLGHAMPSRNTIERVLAREGLVKHRVHRPCFKATGTGLRVAKAPNDVWCIDYKGQFRLGDNSYCYPLTITDQYSRFLLECEGMEKISDEAARETCEQVFRAYGLPAAFRSDNGVPFSSTAVMGLTQLSAYWIRLGIMPERIRPAHPEENGAHERMHRTLKRETARPARGNLLQQQERFDEFRAEYNHERPHEFLSMRRPADVYVRSSRPLPAKLPELVYPLHDDTLIVSANGSIYLPHRGFSYIAAALAGHPVGVREEDDGRLLITFSELDLGHVLRDRKFRHMPQPL